MNPNSPEAKAGWEILLSMEEGLTSKECIAKLRNKYTLKELKAGMELVKEYKEWKRKGKPTSKSSKSFIESSSKSFSKAKMDETKRLLSNTDINSIWKETNDSEDEYIDGKEARDLDDALDNFFDGRIDKNDSR